MPQKPNKIASLYIHIPFCAHICPYCDFPKVIYDKQWSIRYIEALKKEAKARGCGLFDTVYLGGGTPSCLDEETFEELLSYGKSHLAPNGEYSVECNPDTLTKAKVDLLAKHGVNRVSLGAQSSLEKSLKTLGRTHDFEAVRKAVAMLRSVGIDNINVDWMYGFPGQSEEDLRQDIDAFLSLEVPHLSAYSLILEPGTVYGVTHVEPLDDDTQETYFEMILEALSRAGYHRYEISNFALAGHECRHNLTYWNSENYMALGMGASGLLGTTRYRNTLSLSKYLDGHYEGEVETLSVTDQIEEYFLVTLRKTDGFKTADFIERFGLDTYNRYLPRFQALEGRGLLMVSEERIAATKRGMELLDTILRDLFD